MQMREWVFVVSISLLGGAIAFCVFKCAAARRDGAAISASVPP